MLIRPTLIPVILSSLIILLSSCSTVPKEEIVKAKLIGEYCGDGYKLSLGEDMEYRNTKFHIGATSGKLFTEYCRGPYSLSLEDNQWVLVFGKDPETSRTTIYDCEKTVTIWSADEGYVVGEENITLGDLFDNAPLTKDFCE